jgi:predicted RNase H-like nuclease (RuvC/YqgF family)
MMRKQPLGLFALGLALALAVPSLALAQAEEQEQTQEQEKPKKKARKIWTNDDFPERPAPAAKKEEAPKAEAAPQPLEQLFAELDQARADRDRWRDSLPVVRQGLEDLRERRRNADNDYDRNMYDEAIEAAEAELVSTEETVQELEARVAELEQLTKGKKRPPAKPVKPAESTPPSP